MANAEHLAILRKGVSAWNAWRQQNSQSPVDLSGVDLSHVDLSGFNLRHANLASADLSHSIIDETGFTYTLRTEIPATDLRDSNLTDSNFGGAFLGGVSLENATMARADLSGAVICRADLNGTDFFASRAGWGSFDNLDLRNAKNLDSIHHDGPSSIGIDTVIRSNGCIPEAFLHGCGVPESFVTYAKSLVGSAVEFYSCFISYSTSDQEFADRLYSDLQAKGVRCWFAPHDVQGGRKLHEQIDEAIRLHDKLLLLLSEASMASNWVKTEIANARAREEQQKRQVLFPLAIASFELIKQWKCFDADTGVDSAREIREYFIPDFSQWKNHDTYRKAFDRLVESLQASK
jgi:hypothetical protein